MTSQTLYVDPQALRARAAALRQIGTAALQRLDELQTEFAAKGQPWGGDAAGQQFEKDVLPQINQSFSVCDQAARAVLQLADQLGQMADQYEAADLAGAREIANAGDMGGTSGGEPTPAAPLSSLSVPQAAAAPTWSASAGASPAQVEFPARVESPARVAPQTGPESPVGPSGPGAPAPRQRRPAARQGPHARLPGVPGSAQSGRRRTTVRPVARTHLARPGAHRMEVSPADPARRRRPHRTRRPPVLRMESRARNLPDDRSTRAHVGHNSRPRRGLGPMPVRHRRRRRAKQPTSHSGRPLLGLGTLRRSSPRSRQKPALVRICCTWDVSWPTDTAWR